jgi:RNA polymerase sigma-70 factor (ECF subfamily)
VRRQDRLIEAEIPRLRQYARALIGRSEQADDLVEACLERALSVPQHDGGGSSLRLLLLRMQHEICMTWMAWWERGPREQSPGNACRHRAKPHGLRDGEPQRLALESLPSEQRAVILLIALQGLSYEEAAAVLGVPVGTVRSQLARVREHLRQQTQGESAGPPRE